MNETTRVGKGGSGQTGAISIPADDSSLQSDNVPILFIWTWPHCISEAVFPSRTTRPASGPLRPSKSATPMSVNAASVRSAGPNPVVASSAARGSTAPSVSGESSSQRNTTSCSPYLKQLDVSPLNALAKETLLEALTDIQGQKTLVLDKALSGPLGLVTDVALLKVRQFHTRTLTCQPNHRKIPLEPSCG